MDSVSYEKHLEEGYVKYDSLCTRCGECCGAGSEDPCAKLVGDRQGAYNCSVYNVRLGVRETVSGKIFTCVAIRDNIRSGFSHPDCVYVKKTEVR